MEDLMKCSKCEWMGVEDDMGLRRTVEDGVNIDTSTCPQCKNDEFISTNYFEITIPR